MEVLFGKMSSSDYRLRQFSNYSVKHQSCGLMRAVLWPDGQCNHRWRPSKHPPLLHPFYRSPHPFGPPLCALSHVPIPLFSTQLSHSRALCTLLFASSHYTQFQSFSCLLQEKQNLWIQKSQKTTMNVPWLLKMIYPSAGVRKQTVQKAIMEKKEKENRQREKKQIQIELRQCTD